MTTNQTNYTLAEKLIDIIPRIMQFLASCVKNHPTPLPMIHYRLLRVIHEQPMSLSQLAKMVMISKASLSETIKLMVDKGWIERIQDSTDARRSYLKITEFGADHLRHTDEMVLGIISSRLEQLNPEEYQTVLEGSDIISRLFPLPEHWRKF
jgi:DNA-binding MarR family transcriptional regulator